MSARIIEKHIIELVLEAEQPIKHLSESFGNSAIIATRNVRQLDGSIARVPMLSGDAMRHGLRAASAWILVHAINGEQGPQLSEAALRLLFAGGMVTGSGDAGSVRMGEYRRMVEMVPQLAFLGGCAENRTIPGTLSVDDATLVCAESARFLPPWAVELVAANGRAHEATYRESVEEVQRVRMDPSLRPDLRRLLDSGAGDKIERRLEASERASREGDAGAKDAAKSTMMPRRFERLVQGSLFFWRVEVDLFEPLVMDAFYASLCYLAQHMVVGGGHSVGHGKLRVVDARRTVRKGLSLSEPQSIGLARVGDSAESALAPAGGKVGDAFVGHLTERAAKITEYLRTVNA